MILPVETRIALVEDFPELRATLADLLRATSGMEFLGACASGEEALRNIPAWKPDVVLMDIHLPGINGVECVRQLKELLPATEFMMLTIFEEHKPLYDSLAAGATGYLVKKSSPEELLAAIQELRAGGSPMSNLIARKVVSAFRQFGPPAVPAGNLSVREEEVLRSLASGMRYKEIGERLGLSVATVRNHLHNIYGKLQVRTKAAAVRLYRSRPPA